jgi:hypothetical protein
MEIGGKRKGENKRKRTIETRHNRFKEIRGRNDRMERRENRKEAENDRRE